ncbi:hypothetical protein PoB_001265100 [Plakobranchus ocellatus]|uniref:Uncharacterized protein n=1 Tax=Plakobranchus ocellatus TaxID=259542 RepID=A0AAV3YS25_9GAST|nr:hypothetical protein PoB_001265100 [Plakobranchus ocellatus]
MHTHANSYLQSNPLHQLSSNTQQQAYHNSNCRANCPRHPPARPNNTRGVTTKQPSRLLQYTGTSVMESLVIFLMHFLTRQTRSIDTTSFLVTESLSDLLGVSQQKTKKKGYPSNT